MVERESQHQSTYRIPEDAVCQEACFTSCAARVLDVVEAGICVCEGDGEVLYLNAAGEKILGLTPGRAMGADIRDVLCPLETLLERIETGGASGEVWVEGVDGEPMHIGYQLGRTIEPVGRSNAVQTVVLFRDIRDFDRLRRERDRFLRLATVSRLLPTIAHEIKNPLAGIQSLVEVLAEEVREPRHSEDLSVILNEVERLRAIIDGLGLADGDLVGDATGVDLGDEVNSVFRLLSARADLKGVTMACAGETGIRRSVNPSTFRLVLLNLLNNALDACGPGDAITVTAAPAADTLVVEVSDSGCGMAEEIAAKATELFFSTKTRGSGIGLALVAEILRRGGGELEISSRLGKGTTVRMRLPQELDR